MVLMSGEMILHAKVCPEVLREIPSHMPGMTVEQIANLYAKKMSEFNRHHAEQEILAPHDLTHETFLSKQRRMSRDFVLEMSKRLREFSIDADAIVVGLDQRGAQIFRIAPPGIVYFCGTECFATIGTGADHADTQFMIAEYRNSWTPDRALLLAYSAKRQAEMGEGVGDRTDMFYISPQGIHVLTKEEIQELEKIHQSRKRSERRAERAASKKILAYIEKLAAAAQTKEPDKAQAVSDATSSKDQSPPDK